MQNIFSPSDFFDNLKNFIIDKDNNKLNLECNINTICRNNICRDDTNVNKYAWYMYEYLKENDENVMIMNRVTNDEYDDLSSQNIVFLYLVDYSAVNTVIEYIIRNTPLIVNRLPALEEYLGFNYPGFCNELNQVQLMLNDKNYIIKIYLYLLRMDKTKLNIL